LRDAIEYHPLDHFLEQFAISYNRDPSGNPGKLFYRLAQHAAQADPAPFATLVKSQSDAPGGVK